MLFKSWANLFIQIVYRTGKSQLNSACLACNASSANSHFHVILPFQLRYFQRKFGKHYPRLRFKIFIDRFTIHKKTAGSFLDVHTGSRGFSSSYIIFLCHNKKVKSPYIISGF